jgi:hypothetical protein
VKTLLARPIDGDWRHLWIDATYAKVRQNAGKSGRRVVSAFISGIGELPTSRMWGQPVCQSPAC